MSLKPSYLADSVKLASKRDTHTGDKMPVTAAQANAVLKAVKAKFSAYIDGPDYAPILAKQEGRYVIIWEDGSPYEWTYGALDDTAVDAEMTSLVQEFRPGSVVRTKAVAIPAGLFTEAINGCVLGIYEL
jgi:hypothetical protein